MPVGSITEGPLDGALDPPVNALVANVHGTYYATTSKCTHYGLALSKGILTSEGRLYCPFHGACFKVTTGDIEDAPALEPLKTFEVQREQWISDIQFFCSSYALDGTSPAWRKCE